MSFWENDSSPTLLQGSRNNGDRERLVHCWISDVFKEPLINKLSVPSWQPFRILRKVGYQERGYQGNNTCQDALCDMCRIVSSINTSYSHIPRMKIQRQPEYPLIPSILPIALARRPPNAPANVEEVKRIVKRFCASHLLYHLGSLFKNSGSGGIKMKQT